MQQPKARERRRDSRYPITCELRALEMPAIGGAGSSKRLIRGRLHDMSKGGFCVLTDKALKVLKVVRCEIGLAKVPAAIPTVSQVRWIQKNARGPRYRIGMQFLV